MLAVARRQLDDIGKDEERRQDDSAKDGSPGQHLLQLRWYRRSTLMLTPWEAETYLRRQWCSS